MIYRAARCRIIIPRDERAGGWARSADRRPIYCAGETSASSTGPKKRLLSRGTGCPIFPGSRRRREFLLAARKRFPLATERPSVKHLFRVNIPESVPVARLILPCRSRLRSVIANRTAPTRRGREQLAARCFINLGGAHPGDRKIIQRTVSARGRRRR